MTFPSARSWFAARTPRLGADAPFCFALTGLIFFVPALLLPLVAADELGNQRISLFFTGVMALWGQGMWFLSLTVFFCAALLPLALILALLELHVPAAWCARGMARGELAQIASFLRTWAFPEVQVLAVIVGVIKLHTLVDLQIGPGFWCYCGMTASLLLARRSLPAPATRGRFRFLGRKSRTRCAAFAVTALILLIPANLAPVLHTETSGDNRTDTIFSGVVGLGQQGLWGLAAIVFTASILIPGLKLVGLGCLLLHRPPRPDRARLLGRLHRFLIFIGRWSMLDVFLAGFLVGLIEFGEFATVQAQPGLIAFASVVILTVLATDSFDRREISFAPTPAFSE